LPLSFAARHRLKTETAVSTENLRAIKTIEPVNYKLTHLAFLENYTFDDTSRALVNLFYTKRRNTYWGSLGIWMASALVGLAGTRYEDKVVAGSPQGGTQVVQKNGQAVNQPWVVPLFFAGIGLNATYVTVRLTTFSKKKLLLLLIEREQGKPLPPKMSERLSAKYFQ
jgi:hypothetical protein